MDLSEDVLARVLRESNVSEVLANVLRNQTNSTDENGVQKGLISWDDATWILTSAFIIFTMQSGFGLLEAGCVSAKNEVNIMVKNAVDVIFGGISYWLYGYGLCFGMDPGSNAFIGWGSFAVDSSDPDEMGLLYANFIFQLSFATTATTIVSGAMAERTKLSAYIAFSFFNTIVYCIPAHWIWGSNGFLATMGCIDVAGSAGVHLVGAVSGLIATLMLKPRIGKFDKEGQNLAPAAMGNATNALVGMFMLWWGWLGFNCGSTFGISHGKWKLAAKAAVTTINASIGGGVVGVIFGFFWRKRRYDVGDLVNSVLGALVAITAGCAVVRPWEALVIGAIGGFLVIVSTDLFEKIKVDDPVGAVSVHGIGGIWGMVAVGLFVEEDTVMGLHNGQNGLFKGGGWYSLGIQTLACVAVIAWSTITSFLLLLAIKFTVGLRLLEEHERIGSDATEHGIGIHLPIPTSKTTSNATDEEVLSVSDSGSVKDIGRACSVRSSSHADIISSSMSELRAVRTRRRSSFGMSRETIEYVPKNTEEQDTSRPNTATLATISERVNAFIESNEHANNLKNKGEDNDALSLDEEIILDDESKTNRVVSDRGKQSSSLRNKLPSSRFKSSNCKI